MLVEVVPVLLVVQEVLLELVALEEVETLALLEVIIQGVQVE